MTWQKVRTNSNFAYVIWFLFYFLLFWLILGASLTSFLIVAGIYLVSIAIAFSPLAEALWRNMCGVRPLRIRSEKIRLLPLFKEVYQGAVKVNPDLSGGIKLYIQEDMDINAFAFGTTTLVITRGSIELLSDECLKGLLAHELGHFSNYDTVAVLLSSIGNFLMSFPLKILSNIKRRLDAETTGILASIILIPVYLLYIVFKAIDSIGNLILLHINRQNEYRADAFAMQSGFCSEITNALIELYQMAIHKPKSIKEQLKSTHPHITLRIERLEKVLYQ